MARRDLDIHCYLMQRGFHDSDIRNDKVIYFNVDNINYTWRERTIEQFKKLTLLKTRRMTII